MSADDVLRDSVRTLTNKVETLMTAVRQQRLTVNVPTDAVKDSVAKAYDTVFKSYTKENRHTERLLKSNMNTFSNEMRTLYDKNAESLKNGATQLRDATEILNHKESVIETIIGIMRVVTVGAWMTTPIITILLSTWFVIFMSVGKMPSQGTMQGFLGVVVVVATVILLSLAVWVTRKSWEWISDRVERFRH